MFSLFFVVLITPDQFQTIFAKTLILIFTTPLFIHILSAYYWKISFVFIKKKNNNNKSTLYCSQLREELWIQSVCCSVYTPRKKNNKTTYQSKIKSINCISLNLHLFSHLFTYWLFRPQKHQANQSFHVRDMSQQSPLCHGRWKNMKFKLLYFPNNVGYQAGNVEAYISQNAFNPMNIKL